MTCMSFAMRAILFNFQSVRRSFFVFCRNIVTVFTFTTGQCNSYSHQTPPPKSTLYCQIYSVILPNDNTKHQLWQGFSSIFFTICKFFSHNSLYYLIYKMQTSNFHSGSQPAAPAAYVHTKFSLRLRLALIKCS